MVGIIYPQDIRYCPYLGRYTEALRQAGAPFDLIWWERWETPPTTPLPEAASGAEERHVFSRYSRMDQPPLGKLGDFAAYSRYVRKVIRERGYERLILLGTMSAMLLGDLLTGRYKKRFILDIRDYSYERLAFYKALEARIVDASALTCISSDGFREFLPKDRPYVLADNFTDGDIAAAKGMRFCKKSPGEPIRLSYVGFIRYFQENRKILDRLVDDERFLISYHGTGADYDKLLAYQRQRACGRLEVTGYYDFGRDKAALCERADLINNFYPHTLAIQRLATTNKYYDGLIYHRPQLVSADTFSQKLVEDGGVGCALRIDQADFANRLYDYYHQLDEDAFNQNADLAMEKIRRRDALYRERIADFVSCGCGGSESI